MTSFGLRTVSV